MELEQNLFNTIQEILELHENVRKVELITELASLHLEGEEIADLITTVEDEYGFIFFDIIEDIEAGIISTVADLIDAILEQVDLDEYYSTENDSI